MIRHSIAPRFGWQAAVAQDGLVWHTIDDEPYWDESACYEFTREQIEEIEAATVSMYDLFLRVGEAIVGGDWLHRFHIPEWVHEPLRRSWSDEPPALNYGRFDFGYDGKGPPRLFEFNCDTPTSLLEASVIQWRWKEDLFPDADQFNSIHETLVSKWKDLRSVLFNKHLHFTHCMDSAGEDVVTTAYLRDTAIAAGFDTSVVLIDDIGYDEKGRWIDMSDQRIEAIFKLYPWEWIVNEEYGRRVVEETGTLWMEPIWKMIWSNKAILPLLCAMDPGNPHLLDCSYFAPSRGDYVAKPILSREGANVQIIKGGKVLASKGGTYGAEGMIYQELYPLPETAPGIYPVIGSWIVDGTPRGMGIREDGLITGNAARFVPHIFR